MNALLEQSIHGLHASYLDGSRRPTDTLDECLAQIERTEALGAFVRLDQAGARRDAEAADERSKRGALRSPLDGVPIALKDNIITKGLETNAGSKILEGFVPPYDATLVTRLREAGAVIVGKTNLDEFAMGSSTEHSAYGATKNPWDPSRVPGGSSGGSAVAVSARQVYGSFGTDTGGSIRQPASLTGVYGLKPTYGRISRYGLVAYASSLDQAGPFARRLDDLAVLYLAVAGFDPKDATSHPEAVPDPNARTASGVAGRKVGLPSEYLTEGLDPEVESAVRLAAKWLEDAGAKIVPISLPHTRYALSTYYLIATAEASSNLARYDGLRYGPRAKSTDLARTIVESRHQGFGAEVKRRILLGTFVLSAGYYEAYYARAQKVRTLIRRDFEAAFQDVDLMLTPTSPVPAFELGARLSDPLAMYLADVCTLPVSLSGLPALSAPVGLSSAGLPLGAQLIAPWWQETRLFEAALVFEARTDLAQRAPPAAYAADSS